MTYFSSGKLAKRSKRSLQNCKCLPLATDSAVSWAEEKLSQSLPRNTRKRNATALHPLVEYSFYSTLCSSYKLPLFKHLESGEMDLTAWRDYVDVAVAAEGIGRRLKDFADSLPKYLGTQSCGIPFNTECWLISMSWRISDYPHQALDYALAKMLGHAEKSYISVEERAAMKAAHDRLQTYVIRHREQIAAAHNPEASSGKSLRIPLFQSLVLRNIKRIDMDTSE
jgi:hypothetical protein